MILYLMRHGPAAEPGEAPYASDAQRPLTEKGADKTRRAALGMRHLGFTFDWIVTSPLVRAQQTADIVTAAFELPGTRLRTSDHLRPDGDSEQLLAEIAALEPHASALLVGHEPLLSGLAARLLVHDAPLRIELKKGAVCAIELDDVPPRAKSMLVALLQPRHLRAAHGD